jgi:hypothetical protein
MAAPIIASFINENFLSGCVGAIAPEALRLYNLRTQPEFRWSPGYLACVIPFILIGGCIACLLEPTTKWAAFYSGLTAPVLLSTALKDSVKAQKELSEIQNEFDKLKQENNSSEDKIKKLETQNKDLQLQMSLLKKDFEDKELEELSGQKEFIDSILLDHVKRLEHDRVKRLEHTAYCRRERDSPIQTFSTKIRNSSPMIQTENKNILIFCLLIVITAVPIVIFAHVNTKIVLFLLFLIFCNLLIAPQISKNKIIRQYLIGL